MEPYLAQIVLFSGDFAPRGWALCHGQILPINANQSLYSLIGAFYGGDGRTTFALPDLRGRVPVSAGRSAASNTDYPLAQMDGEEAVSLTLPEIPAHTHNILAQSGSGSEAMPQNAYLAEDPNGALYSSQSADVMTKPTSSTGGGAPHTNMMPFQSLNYIICVQGLFPSRS